jgi:hypothetical protein
LTRKKKVPREDVDGLIDPWTALNVTTGNTWYTDTRHAELDQ